MDAEEIRAAIGDDIEVLCAPDLPPKTILPDFDLSAKPLQDTRVRPFRLCVAACPKEESALLFERLVFI